MQQEINELRTRVEGLERQLKKKEKYKDTKSRFIPEDSDDYYYISAYGIILADACRDTDVDDYRISIGNCFKTEEEAEKQKRVLINTQKLKDLADALNGSVKINWKDRHQEKYSIILNAEQLSTGINYFCRLQGAVYCLDKNFLAKAIEEIGEKELIELIKGE